jgi:hypothetical protein
MRTDPGAAIDHCADLAQGAAILRYIESRHPQDVFLASRWSLYDHGWLTHGRLATNTHFLASKGDRPANATTSRAALEKALPQTVAALLTHAQVTIVETTPVLKLEAPDIALLPQGAQARYLPSLSGHQDFETFASTLFTRLPRHPGLHLLDPATRLCMDVCDFQRKGALLYTDDNHLSAQGALLFVPDIEARLAQRQAHETVGAL